MTKPKYGKFHWLKWWPKRWRGDQAVQLCSLAARGAWHEILNVMHLENSGGVLLVGGEIPDDEDIAKLIGCTVREWKSVEAELERRRVFSRRSDGAIYCRSRVMEGAPADDPSGRPAGDSSGAPPALSRVSDGIPPSRALSSSRPLSSHGLTPEGGPGRDDSSPPDGQSRMAEALAFHAELDSPEVRAALTEFEKHRASSGKPAWTRQAWSRLCLDWKRRGTPEQCRAWLLRAIDTAMKAGACTPFETEHAQHKPQSTGVVGQPPTKPEDELRDRWLAKCGRTKVPHPHMPGRTVEALREYPGDERARADLAALNGTAPKAGAR